MWTQIAVILFGFVALAKAQCGGQLSDQSGTFTSPNHPNNYNKNSNCVWTLDAQQQQFTLSFASFDVEVQATCNYDYVEIKSGQTVLAKLCGATLPESITLSGAITITLKSDSSVQASGFSASYSTNGAVVTSPVATTPATSGCGGRFVGETGTVSSPNYPNNYDNNLFCEYYIEIPAGNVLLTFQAFDVETSSGCSYDYLEVLENGVSKAKVCGSNPQPYKASSKSVTLKFKTDGSVNGKGFQLQFSRSVCPYTCGSGCAGTVVDDFCPNSGICCMPNLSAEGCGVRKESNKRIVGGNHADRHEWPWQASLQTTSSSFHFCGATLINNFWAMTAAHCVDGSTASSMKVVLGEHHVTASEEVAPPVTKSIAKVIMHENYNGNTNGFPNDIALLKFTSPVTEFTDQIRPACLPEAGMVISDNDDCWISGWGNTQDSSHASEILNELNIDVLTNEVCNTKWGSSINAGHVCLGNGNSGACNGDSGGPLSCKGADGKWYVNGATSWGRTGCQTEGYPSVYSRVTYFLDWINEKLTQN